MRNVLLFCATLLGIALSTGPVRADESGYSVLLSNNGPLRTLRACNLYAEVLYLAPGAANAVMLPPKTMVGIPHLGVYRLMDGTTLVKTYVCKDGILRPMLPPEVPDPNTLPPVPGEPPGIIPPPPPPPPLG